MGKNLTFTPLGRNFFVRPSLVVARELVGCVLQTEFSGLVTSLLIVETEAYPGYDPYSHFPTNQPPVAKC